jgi:large subunit ribosomal protein L32
MRRSHDGLTKSTLTVDGNTGETHRRHHISEDGMYKGRQVIAKREPVQNPDDNEETAV